MEVFEINFNISNQIPINIFSTLGINENGELIKMINIESLNGKEMTIEIFGNGNFYNKSWRLDQVKSGKSNIANISKQNTRKSPKSPKSPK